MSIVIRSLGLRRGKPIHSLGETMQTCETKEQSASASIRTTSAGRPKKYNSVCDKDGFYCCLCNVCKTKNNDGIKLRIAAFKKHALRQTRNEAHIAHLQSLREAQEKKSKECRSNRVENARNINHDESHYADSDPTEILEYEEQFDELGGWSGPDISSDSEISEYESDRDIESEVGDEKG